MKANNCSNAIPSLRIAAIMIIVNVLYRSIESLYNESYMTIFLYAAVLILSVCLVRVLYFFVDAKEYVRTVLLIFTLSTALLLMFWFSPAYTYKDAASVLSKSPEFSHGRIIDMNFHYDPENDPDPSMVGFKKSILYRKPYKFVFIEAGDSAQRETPKVHNIMFNPLTGVYKQYESSVNQE